MSARAPGRPRSEKVRQAVIGAALDLIERDGYGALTMEGIAREAGVSKQTVYRWWSRKAEIVLEGLTEGAAVLAPLPEHGTLEEDVRDFVRRSVRGAGGRRRRILTALMAEAQIDPDFGESFRRGFLAERRAVLREIFENARERGELAKSAHPAFLAEIVFALIWYRMLAANAALDMAFADQLAQSILRLAQEK